LNNQTLGLIIPIYKNEESIHNLCNEINNLEKILQSEKINTSTIFVVDGSPDCSRDLIVEEKRIRDKQNWNIAVLSRNFGQTNALLAGLSLSKADFHVCMSADLQDPPELIQEFVKMSKRGYSIVIGVRESRSDSLLAQITSRAAYYFLRREMEEIPKSGFDFFLVNEQVRKELLAMRGLNRFLQGDISSLGFKRALIPYHRGARPNGKSSYSISARFKLFFNFIIDVSNSPLRLLTLIGFATAFIGFVLALLAFLSYLQGNLVFRGFTPIYLGILIFGGLQLLSLGVLGEYVIRIYGMLRNRPAWVIESVE
jgi:polyisoprenyl-phosphate glycosyltransferase